MKPLIKFTVYSLLAGIIIFVSCKKEYSCENCNGTDKNTPPAANAGPDQVITLPTDSVSLDGTASNDPGGRISEWLWTKISGPASFTITNSSIEKTTVKNLVAGTYHFELKVTDNGGLSASDTVRIEVNDPRQPDRPPIANAGSDETITLPTNTVNLDGGSSIDLDNNITAYSWTKISGPTKFNISNANAVQTQVINLEQGLYQFELKVTDAVGLFSKDTVLIAVKAVLNTNCSISNRPTIQAKLIPIGTLSQPRYCFVTSSAGNKILFAGGSGQVDYSTRVDIYDVSTNTWSTAELSQGERQGIAVATVGNKIFFAGGGNSFGVFSRVDIYDASTNAWSTAELSQARGDIATTTLGNKVFFAGGGYWDGYYKGSKTVDIYDSGTNTWSIASLSEGRSFLSANTIGDKTYFAGGNSGSGSWQPSTKIDIYDSVANTWSVSSLNEGKAEHAAISFGNKIYWAGGIINSYTNESGQVEIRDINTGVSSFGCIAPRSQFAAVIRNENIVFFTGWPLRDGYHFDIYNTTTDTWSTGVLPQSVGGAAIISVNNTIYLAGGYVNDVLSDRVWKLEF